MIFIGIEARDQSRVLRILTHITVSLIRIVIVNRHCYCEYMWTFSVPRNSSLRLKWHVFHKRMDDRRRNELGQSVRTSSISFARISSGSYTVIEPIFEFARMFLEYPERLHKNGKDWEPLVIRFVDIASATHFFPFTEHSVTATTTTTTTLTSYESLKK